MGLVATDPYFWKHSSGVHSRERTRTWWWPARTDRRLYRTGFERPAAVLQHFSGEVEEQRSEILRRKRRLSLPLERTMSNDLPEK